MAEASTEARPRSVRLAIAGGLFMAWLATLGLAWLDVTTREATARDRAEQSLTVLADVVGELYEAEEGRIDGELARLRTELRAEGTWAAAGTFDLEEETEAARSSDRASIEGRRLEASLRRALVGVDGFSALEVVVAGHDGLRIIGVERDEDGRPRRIEWPSEVREGAAKALWYVGEVSRAVESAGRRVERGDVAFEGVLERPTVRAVVGLHDAGQLVQGALVATVDLTELSERLAGIVPVDQRMTLLSVEGRPLDPTARDRASLDRLTTLTMRIVADTDHQDVFEADGALVLGRPLVRAEGGFATTLAVLEVDAPPRGAAAWLTGFWPAALGLFTTVAGVALVFVLRRPVAAEGASRPQPAPVAVVAPALDLTSEPVPLREWLADIRGCLEREAATRGLAVEVRCEKSMPTEFESDPGWLGGLVVAMGREALGATAEGRIVVEVLEDEGETLRVEVDAGEVPLQSVAGMNEVATGLGGQLEAGAAGRLVLTVPTVLG